MLFEIIDRENGLNKEDTNRLKEEFIKQGFNKKTVKEFFNDNYIYDIIENDNLWFTLIEKQDYNNILFTDIEKQKILKEFKNNQSELEFCFQSEDDYRQYWRSKIFVDLYENILKQASDSFLKNKITVN